VFESLAPIMTVNLLRFLLFFFFYFFFLDLCILEFLNLTLVPPLEDCFVVWLLSFLCFFNLFPAVDIRGFFNLELLLKIIFFGISEAGES
jgi:hypothetical protein